MTETPLELLLEAQLFAAGRSLSVKELLARPNTPGLGQFLLPEESDAREQDE